MAVDVMIKGSKLRYGNVGELNTRGLRTGKSQPDDYDDDDDDDDDDDEYSCVLSLSIKQPFLLLFSICT